MNRFFKTQAVIVAAALALSACAGPFGSADAPIGDVTPVIGVATQDWSIETLEIVVPRTLAVSEANTIKPAADIVWREDPPGDRYDQVEAVMRAALDPVLQPRDGAGTPVMLTLTVTRFHALTERARYTTGGEHEIEFDLLARHAGTGAVLAGPLPVDLTFRAFGGQQAIEAEAAGITQRSRITERLRAWAAAEFPAPAADLAN